MSKVKKLLSLIEVKEFKQGDFVSWGERNKLRFGKVIGKGKKGIVVSGGKGSSEEIDPTQLEPATFKEYQDFLKTMN